MDGGRVASAYRDTDRQRTECIWTADEQRQVASGRDGSGAEAERVGLVAPEAKKPRGQIGKVRIGRQRRARVGRRCPDGFHNSPDKTLEGPSWWS